MKYLIFRKNGLISKFRIFILIVAFLVLVFATTSVAISVRYDISVGYTSKQLVRQGLLTIIDVATQIYDPISIKSPSNGPVNGKQGVTLKDYIRIEGFFGKNKLQGRFHVKALKNEKIKRSIFHFGYQHYKEPKLHTLRNEYNLDSVIEAAKNEFEAMILLRNWTRSQFRRNDYQPFMEDFNALEILRKNIRNKNNDPYMPNQYNPCYFFPLFYSQILLSMGYQARLVRISHLSDRGYDGHGMTEVWSNQFRKWITMDADLNLHYEKDGIPLNLLEVHNERYKKGLSNVKIIRGIQTSGDFQYEKEINVEDMIEYHSYIQILDMRNNWMTNHYFRGHPKRSDKATLFWVDKNLPPVFNFKQKTNNKDDFYWTLNQTEIWANKQVGSWKEMTLLFETFTPNFDYFEIWVDDFKKCTTRDSFYLWKLHSGENKLIVRSFNKFGVLGIPSSVEIFAEHAQQIAQSGRGKEKYFRR